MENQENQEYFNISLKKKVWILLIALVGFITTIKLAIIYYNANFNPYALSSFCSVNEFIDCDGVAKTVESQFMGIPLACWGMFFYMFITLLIFVDKLKNIKLFGFLEVFKRPGAYIAALGLIAFTISIILAGVSLFEIKKVCILCVFTYFLNLIIALIALENGFKGLFNAFKYSVLDLIEALKIRKYLVTFIILVLLLSGILAYTTFSYVFTPHVKVIKSMKEFIKMEENPFKVEGNVIGDPQAKVVVKIYTDYKCPICSVYNLIIYRLATELNNVRFEHHNLPLDRACNKYMRNDFHYGSCMLAKYSIASEMQGKGAEINAAFFEKQPMIEQQIIGIALNLGMDTKKLKSDAESAEVNEILLKDIEEAYNLGITGTPANVISGKVTLGIIPYYELKEKLIKLGAVNK